MRAPGPRSAAFFVSLLVSSLAVVAAAPTPALAANPKGDQAAVEKVTALNKQALDAYGKENYDDARALLKEALELCATARLDQHPITARTHIHFGVVAIVGFKQREVGIKQFRKALEIQPDIKLTKSLVTPELQDAFEEAVLASNGGANGGAAAGGGEEGGNAPGQQADEGEGGATPPPRARRPPPPRKKRGGEGEEDEKEDEGPGQSGSFFFGVAAGTGFGVASGKGALDPYAHQLSGAGFAMAQAAQIAPEVGFFLNQDLLLSVALRLQLVTGLNGKPSPSCSGGFCDPGTTALAGFAKATWLLGEAPFRITLGGQIGGGYIRHAVVFPNDTTCKASPTGPNQQCVDTLDGGPFLIGPTAGFFWELGSAVDLIFAVNTALGVPNFTFNFDVQAGLGFRL
jgi:hypothetical protein